MFCAKCGKAVNEDARFCPSCGAATGSSEQPAASSVPPRPAPPSLEAKPGGLVDRVKNILLSPSSEWPVIARESGSTLGLYTGYIMLLAAIGPIASFIGSSLIGTGFGFFGHLRVPLAAGLSAALLQYLLSLATVLVVAWLVNTLAPSFGGQKDSFAALKLTAYSYTAAWLAGIFHLIPMLGTLGLLAALYGIYLIYLGLPVLMRCPQDKAAGYCAVVVILAIVIAVVSSVIAGALHLGSFGGMGGYGPMGMRPSVQEPSTAQAAGALARLFGGKTEEDTQRVNQALQKLSELGEKAKQADPAAKAGTGAAPAPGAATPADMVQAMGAVGQVLSGGKNVEPVDFHELKNLLPETLAGLPRNAASGERGEGMGFKASHARGRYGRDGAQLDLEITDLGSAAGLASLVASFNPDLAREDDDGYERTATLRGQLVHEKFNRRNNSGSVAVVVGNRFSVELKAQGIDMGALRAALAEVDLARLGSLAGK